jgi:hypothetical protein
MNVANFMKDLLTRLIFFFNIPLIDHEHVFIESTVTNVIQFSKLCSKSTIPYPLFL